MAVSSELAFRSGQAPFVRDTEAHRTSSIPPLSGWDTPGQNVVFSIPPSEREWISGQFHLDALFSIQKSDGSDLDPGMEAAFSNLPVASFFQSVRLSLAGTTIEGLDSNWSVRSWITSLLSISYIAREYYGKTLWKYIPDLAYQAQNFTDAANPGWQARRMLCGNSQKVFLRSPIPFSFSTSSLAIPPGVSIQITLVNSPEGHRIQTTSQNLMFIKFHKIRLLASFLSLSPSVDASLTSKLHASGLTYPHLNCRILNIQTLPIGTLESTLTISRGEVADLVLFGLIRTRLTDNGYDHNWQDFQANDIAFLQCEVEGKYFPRDGYSLNFDDGDGTFECYDLFTEVCRSLSGDGSCSYATWAGGNCLIPVQIAQHLPSLRYSNPKTSGLLTAKLRFRTQIPASLNVYCFAISTTNLVITRDRSIVLPSAQ